MPTWEAHTHPPLQVSDSNIDLTPHRYSTVAGPVAIQEGQGAWPYNATQQQHSLSAHPVSISYPYQAQSYSDDKVTETNFGPRRSLSTDPDLSNFQYSAPLPSSSDLIPTSQPHCMQDSSSNMTFQEHAGHGFGFPQDCLPSMPWLPTQDEFRQDSGYAGDDSCNHTPLHQSTPFSQVDPSFATTFTQSPMNDYDGAIGHEDVHGMAQSWQPGPQYEFNEAVCGRLNQSYASLIFTCLLQAPDHSRKLKEIYSWIEEHSNKASDDPGSRGWQNSVRHNLSMNKVCRSCSF